MVNDTILKPRQKKILELLEEKGDLSRLELSDLMASRIEMSRITLIRDLYQLKTKELIKVNGKGRATKYGLVKKNRLLKYLDMNGYFDVDVDERGGKSTFDEKVFEGLTNLYSKEEMALWEKSVKLFKRAKEKLDPTIYRRELERFVIELSWKSSQIEGNTYSLIETETLIKQNVRAKGHSEEEAIMILNHKYAFDVILSKQETFKKLDMADVVQLHNVLTKGLVSSGIRTQPVRITGTTYKPPADKHRLEDMMRRLIKHVNAISYPPEKALVLAVMIAYLQPFADGNKRTSRMLANAALMAYDYFPLSYRNIDVNEYRSAMIIFYETNNLFNFKRLFMDQLKFALNNYFQE